MITVLARTEPHHFGPATVEDLPGLLEDRHGVVWVDFQEASTAELILLSDIFHFHPLTIEDATNEVVDPPKVDDYGEYLFVIAQAMQFAGDSEGLITTELNIYLGVNYVVTVHQRPLPFVDAVRSDCERGMHHTCQGPDWLMHALLDMMVDRLLPVVEAMDKEIEELEDKALVEGARDVLERVSSLKRQTLRMRWLVAPQRDVMSRLGRGDFSGLIREETLMYYRDIHDHLMRLDTMIDGLRDLGESVIAIHLSTQNNRMNEIMKTLSIVGSIFLPLTLVASVFGTNFDSTYMPSGWLGFGLMCGSFLVSSGAMLVTFKRRRWI